jgi:hypothetical protein
MTKQCNHCKKQFILGEDDLEFYKKIKVPTPQLCPDCRCQRRLLLRNERTLYPDTCDLCEKKIVSLYSEDKPYKVYCYDCFYSDKWNPLSYGQDFDFSRGFFEQFKELQLKVPRIYAYCVNNENSEYTNGSGYNKGCYMIFVSDHNEDSLYSYSIFNCRNVMDCLNCYDCELCYECSGCHNCFNSKNLTDCSNCNECSDCLDCKGCSSCYGCVGLRNAEYHIFNKKYTPNEYNNKIKNINSNDLTNFNELKSRHFYLYRHGLKNENSTGDYINRCKDSFSCYDSHDLENCKYIINGNKAKDTYDGYMVGDNTELSNEILGSLGCNDCQVNFFTMSAYNCEYTDSCKSSKNLFGCVSVKNEEFCILNKKYSEESFDKLRIKIIEHMKQTKEYGEFFPIKNSPFAYNETAAQEYYPITKEEAQKNGWQWKEEQEKEIDWSFPVCLTCKKNYNFIPQELKFYKQQKIDQPKKCFNCRHLERLQQRNPRKLFDRECFECRCKLQSTYAPEREEKIYCETCYNKKVN